MDFWLLFVAILWIKKPAVAVKITTETENHIDHCIEIHQADSTGVMIGTVIQPPLCLPVGELNESHFLFPKLVIWDPMKRYKLICPTHNQELKASFWLGKQQQWRQPRMLYDLHGNVLLVGRYYTCSHMQHCRYLSIDDRILEQLPRDLNIPFLLFHRSGCTRDLVEHVYTWVSEGCTFMNITRRIQDTNYKHFCTRIQNVVDHGLNQEKGELVNLVKRLLFEFRSMELYNAPSSNLLEVLFLQEFKTRRDAFTKVMRTLSAKTLSVSVLSFDNLWSAQYRNLIIVFNENHQVVTWAFSKSYEFEEVRPLFVGLHNRLVMQGVVPECVHIDNCCEWRPLFNQFSLDVKQDLHQTVRHVTSTVPKKGSTGLDRSSFQRDFSLVFRNEDDQNEERTKPTPAPSVIQSKLERFVKRWETFGDTVLLNNECRQLLDTLSAHIIHGCFSGIRPGEGSEGNMGLLNILQNRKNSLLSHAKNLGPELLFAVLSVVFHYWNKSNTPKKIVPKKLCYDSKRSKKDPSSAPDGNATENENSYVRKGALTLDSIDVSAFFSYLDSSTNGTFKEQFGFIGGWQMGNSSTIAFSSVNSNYQHPPMRYVTNLDDVLVVDTSRHIISEMLDLHDVIQNIGKLSTGQSNTSGFQLAHVQLHHMLYLLAAKSTENEQDQSLAEHTERLNKQLENLRLQRVPISGDGDCAFSSIIYQLMQVLSSTEIENENIAVLKSHLSALGLVGSREDQIFRLRELFVNEIMGNKDEYMLQYTNFTSVEHFLVEAERFRYPHVFSGQLGDLVIKVLSIILQCPIAVVTSMEGIPIIPFLPEKSIVKTPLFIAYTQHGPGHYDATCPMQSEETTTESQVEESENNFTSCRCGSNTVKKYEDKVTCANVVSGDEKVKYKTRCQCFKNGRDCSSCLCINCGNKNNPADLLCAEHSLHNCRRCNKKRKEIEKNGPKTVQTRRKRKKLDTDDFINNFSNTEKSSAAGPWTQMENCLLEVVHSLLSSTCVEVSAENISKVFNFVCNDPANMCLGLAVQAKTQKCIESKLEKRKENLEGSFQKSNISSTLLSAENAITKGNLQFRLAGIVPTAIEQSTQHQSAGITASVTNSMQGADDGSSVVIPSIEASVSLPQIHLTQTIPQPQNMTFGNNLAGQVTTQRNQAMLDSMRQTVENPQALLDTFKTDAQQTQSVYDTMNSLVQYYQRPEHDSQQLQNAHLASQNVSNVQNIHTSQSVMGIQTAGVDQAINATIGSDFHTLQNVPIHNTTLVTTSSLPQMTNAQVKSEIQTLQPVSFVQNENEFNPRSSQN